jgi:ADP-ribose pyrophosphatase
MPLRPWRVTDSRLLVRTRIFDLVEDISVSPRTDAARPFVRLVSGDWVNVIPVTTERRIVLVRQWRSGIRRFTLEIPGGMMGPDECGARAAAREVREETGYAGDAPVRLGIVSPNPAILTNHCETYLIENCRRVGDLQQDEGEDIEVVTRPLSEVPALVASGQIDHALVICGFWWLRQERPDLLG